MGRLNRPARKRARFLEVSRSMADGDMDLDSMLDSAFDEATTSIGKEESKASGEPKDGDLDSMLDDALNTVSVAPATRNETGSESGGSKTSTGTKASREFGPSQQWLQRKQGRKPQGSTSGTGVVKGGSATEPWAFLNSARQEAWKTMLAADAKRQDIMERQRPLSRAYRSFYPGKESDVPIVHLGSGAAGSEPKDVGASEQGTGPGEDAGNAEEGQGGVAVMFEDTLAKAVANSGVEKPPSVDEEDYEALDRLKASYLHLVAKDVRARVMSDPDVDPARFPAIAAKIMA